MEKSGIMVLGILSILVLVVAASGCTSSNTGNTTSTSPSYKNDIEVSAASYDYFAEDNSATGGCYIINNGNVTYKGVKINLEIYDTNGNVVGNATRTVGQIRPGEEINYFAITEKPIPTGVSASATVEGATPV